MLLGHDAGSGAEGLLKSSPALACVAFSAASNSAGVKELFFVLRYWDGWF